MDPDPGSGDPPGLFTKANAEFPAYGGGGFAVGYPFFGYGYGFPGMGYGLRRARLRIPHRGIWYRTLWHGWLRRNGLGHGGYGGMGYGMGGYGGMGYGMGATEWATMGYGGWAQRHGLRRDGLRRFWLRAMGITRTSTPETSPLYNPLFGVGLTPLGAQSYMLETQMFGRRSRR